MNHVTQQKLNGWSVMQLQCTLRVKLTLDIGIDCCGQAKDGVFFSDSISELEKGT